ncbi:MAG: ATP-binding cassette domain-containing protein [Desulfurococcaceae archaeon]
MSPYPPAIEMRGITKTFPGVVALDNVDFIVEKGEIHALLGENGAGKTTLMNILYGFYQRDKGEVKVYGESVNFKNPREAMTRGIFMVSQHFSLIEEFTPWENVAMIYKGSSLTINKREVIVLLTEVMSNYGIFIENLEVPIKKLSVVDKQKLEILKALICGGNILIFDEPTSVLPPQEVDALLNTIKKLNNRGKTIIYVTHKIGEVYRIANKVTVLRAGKNLGTFDITEIKPETLVELIMGVDRKFEKTYENFSESNIIVQSGIASLNPEEVVLEISNLSYLDKREGRQLKIDNLVVRKGEVVGIAGLANSGQKTLVECIIGVRKADRGDIKFKNIHINKLPPHERISLGISILPEDRMTEGIYPELSIQVNASAGHHKIHPLKELKNIATSIVKEFNVKAKSLRDPIVVLSGGNIQRLLVGKTLTKKADLYVLFHPTRGLDIRSTSSVHEKILSMKREGKSFIIISEDLEELTKLSDRIVVMYEGHINGTVERTEKGYDLYKIGELMTGGKIG